MHSINFWTIDLVINCSTKIQAVVNQPTFKLSNCLEVVSVVWFSERFSASSVIFFDKILSLRLNIFTLSFLSSRLKSPLTEKQFQGAFNHTAITLDFFVSCYLGLVMTEYKLTEQNSHSNIIVQSGLCPRSDMQHK